MRNLVATCLLYDVLQAVLAGFYATMLYLRLLPHYIDHISVSYVSNTYNLLFAAFVIYIYIYIVLSANCSYKNEMKHSTIRTFRRETRITKKGSHTTDINDQKRNTNCHLFLSSDNITENNNYGTVPHQIN